MQFSQPPEGAVFPERSACTIPTVSALPDFVRPLNLQLSVSPLRRLTLSIVLSPVQNARRFVLPPEGANSSEPCAYTTRCSLQLSTNHCPLTTNYKMNRQFWTLSKIAYLYASKNSFKQHIYGKSRCPARFAVGR